MWLILAQYALPLAPALPRLVPLVRSRRSMRDALDENPGERDATLAVALFAVAAVLAVAVADKPLFAGRPLLTYYAAVACVGFMAAAAARGWKTRRWHAALEQAALATAILALWLAVLTVGHAAGLPGPYEVVVAGALALWLAHEALQLRTARWAPPDDRTRR